MNRGVSQTLNKKALQGPFTNCKISFFLLVADIVLLAIILGTGTDFQLFLGQMACGNIYYDPGIKMENIATKPKIKKRSQFRIKSQLLPNLYKLNEIIDTNL